MAEKQFTLGEQPEWAGTEDCAPKDISFIDGLLKENPSISLVKRGYAVVELPPDVVENYSNFHSAFEAFSQFPIEEKQKFALKQFEHASHSPNQFHGFSVVGGLKEQFMMRLCGSHTPQELPTPGNFRVGPDQTVDLGVVGMKLYEQLDQLCRKTAKTVAKTLHIAPAKVDGLLDPIYQIGQPVLRDSNNIDVCYSSYVIPGFISSSIMDNFHYYNTFSKEEKSDEKFFNNHAAHTDSGLLTVVVVTDVPGLEVYDQELKEWIALEQLLHQYVPTVHKHHRQYATIFWGDSVAYLNTARIQPCMHRVGKSHKERYSVVFKQRTSPLATACRYQEDYLLGSVQLAAMNAYQQKSIFHHPLFYAGVTAAVVGIGAFLRIKQIL